MFLGLCSHPSQFRHGWRNRCKQPWMADFASVADILNKYFRVLRTSCFEQPEAKRIDIFVYTFKTLTPIWPQHHIYICCQSMPESYTKIPTMSFTTSAAAHATAHCHTTTPTAHFAPSSRLMAAIAATQGV